MRRKDREVTDPAKIKDIIESCHCCRLGFNDNGKVYIVPMNFGYEETGDKRTFYFHSAAEGRKIELIKAGGSVGFELDANYSLHASTTPCGYSAGFQSVIGTGTASIVEDDRQKAYALRRIMFHNTGKIDWSFPDAMLSKVCVFKLDVEELSCKEHE